MRELIKYMKYWDWHGYILTERKDGLWVYEQDSWVSGEVSGRRVVLEPPEGWSVACEADMEARPPTMTKADELVHDGHEVRCLRRGQIVK